jgi:GNAT superfamily N-acetyltransferase
MANTTVQMRTALPRTTTVTLRDGARVELARMQPSDAGRLDRFHHTLSIETTHFRFFSVHPELSPTELHWFTHVDHRDREAIVALNGEDIVGVARFDRIAGTSDAEVAFVVADSWQGRGLGGILLRHLEARARRVGIRRLVAQTLASNQRMLAVFRHCGLPVAQRFEDGVINVTIDLGRATSCPERPEPRTFGPVALPATTDD